MREQPVRVALLHPAVFVGRDRLDKRANVGDEGQFFLLEQGAGVGQRRVQGKGAAVAEGRQIVGTDGQQAAIDTRVGHADAVATQVAVTFPRTAAGGHQGVGLVVAAVHEQADQRLVVITAGALGGGRTDVGQVDGKGSRAGQGQPQGRTQQAAAAVVVVVAVVVVLFGVHGFPYLRTR